LAANASREGEIVASGPSVSPGYLHDAERTKATRIRAMVDGEAREFYRTGDYGRLDGDGVLHFQGRRDGMVKTRGFRVELGDVEAAIANHPDVAEVGVLPVGHPSAGTVLEAHVVLVPDASLAPKALQAWLGTVLPAYMVPATVHVRDALPRTSTGKLARGALGGTP
jgi:acyl-coenzyme A synthetase/AMP-(fatty) acid ligase